MHRPHVYLVHFVLAFIVNEKQHEHILCIETLQKMTSDGNQLLLRSMRLERSSLVVWDA